MLSLGASDTKLGGWNIEEDLQLEPKHQLQFESNNNNNRKSQAVGRKLLQSPQLTDADALSDEMGTVCVKDTAHASNTKQDISLPMFNSKMYLLDMFQSDSLNEGGAIDNIPSQTNGHSESKYPLAQDTTSSDHNHEPISLHGLLRSDSQDLSLQKLGDLLTELDMGSPNPNTIEYPMNSFGSIEDAADQIEIQSTGLSIRQKGTHLWA
jgi:hypothetical protein